jgi:uncharacterized phage protein gp47/JayE
MALFAKDPDLIIQESIEYLSQYTSINSTGAGSKLRTLIEIMKEQLGEAYKLFDFNVAIGFVYGARGIYLDYLGDIFGIKRRQRSTAKASSTSKIVKFYTYNSTFGAINSNEDILIPAGTKVWAMKSGQKIEYRVLNNTVLDKDSSVNYVDVIANETGSFSNVQAGSIKYHDFTDYTDSAKRSLLVNNQDSIENGLSEETDEDFRYRLVNQRLTELTANETAIRMTALSVPGVADVEVDPSHGYGMTLVFIKSTTPVLSDEVKNDVQDAIDIVAAAGTKAIAMGPNYTELSFTIRPIYKPETTVAESEAAESSIIQALTDYINNLDIEETFYYNNAIDVVISSHPAVVSAGRPNKFFEDITAKIYDSNSYSSIKHITGDYVPVKYEKLIAANNPVTILS